MPGMDLSEQRILITGGAGFLGRVVQARLRERGAGEQALCVPRRADFDLTREADVRRLYETAFDGEPTDLVIHLAAEVGGIGANQASPGPP